MSSGSALLGLLLALCLNWLHRRLGPWLTGSGGTATAQPLSCWAALVTRCRQRVLAPPRGPVNWEFPACPVFIRQRPQHLPWVMRAGECQKGRSLTACEVTITCRVGAPLLCPLPLSSCPPGLVSETKEQGSLGGSFRKIGGVPAVTVTPPAAQGLRGAGAAAPQGLITLVFGLISR